MPAKMQPPTLPIAAALAEPEDPLLLQRPLEEAQAEAFEQLANGQTEPTYVDYEQPRNSKRQVDLTRRFDTTQLTTKMHGLALHRDYLAHTLRWRFAADFDRYTSDQDGHWLAGLIDGEGSFILKAEPHVKFEFKLNLREDDWEGVERAQAILGVGSCYLHQNNGPGNTKPSYTLAVTSRQECWQVAAFFSRFPLRSKKRADYETWALALAEFNEEVPFDNPRGKRPPEALLERMQLRAQELKDGRLYLPLDERLIKMEGLDQALRIVHYPDFCFKWGWSNRWIQRGDFVLDVGCGQEQPLARILAMSAGTFPAMMVACDYNRISKPFNVQWLETLDEFDYTERWPECLELIPESPLYERRFDIAVCFETIEHMRSTDADKLLLGVHESLKQNGQSRFFLSTPNFNGRAAANHLKEWTVPELQATLEALGFRVYARFGTFASYPDIKRVASPEHLELLERARIFYSDDVAACYLAPLYPDHSRNNVWVCGRAEEAT